jgi:hypothetical protein
MANPNLTEEDILLILLKHQRGIKPDILCSRYGITSDALNEWLQKYGSVSKDDVHAAKADVGECRRMKNFIGMLNRAYSKNPLA